MAATEKKERVIISPDFYQNSLMSETDHELSLNVASIYRRHGLDFPLVNPSEGDANSYAGLVLARKAALHRVRVDIAEAMVVRYGLKSDEALTAAVGTAIAGPIDDLFYSLLAAGAPNLPWSAAAPKEAGALDRALGDVLKDRQFSRLFKGSGVLKTSLRFLKSRISAGSEGRIFFELAAHEMYAAGKPVIWLALEKEYLPRVNPKFNHFEPAIRFFMPVSREQRQVMDSLAGVFWEKLLGIYEDAGIASRTIRGVAIARSKTKPVMLAGISLWGAGADILSSISGEAGVPRMVAFFPNTLKYGEATLKVQRLTGITEQIPEILKAFLYLPHELGHCYYVVNNEHIGELVNDLGYVVTALPILESLPKEVRDSTLKSFLTLMIADCATWYGDEEFSYHASSTTILNQLFKDGVVEIDAADNKLKFNLGKIDQFIGNCQSLLRSLLREDSGIERETTQLGQIKNVKPRQETEQLMKVLKI